MNLTEATILALQGKLKLSEDVSVATDNQSVVSVDNDKTTIFTPEETVTVEPVADEAKIQEVLPEETKEEPKEEVTESTTKKHELTESNNESISEKVIDYVEETGMESDFVAEFQKWASKGLLDTIKEDIIKENDTRYFVLEDLSPDDEEYQEIEEMSDAELYDKLEDKGYFDQDDLNTIWFEQIQDIGRSNLNEFCSDFDSLYLNGEFTDEEDEDDEDDEDEDELDESKSVQDISAPTTEEKPLTESKEEDSISEKVLDYVKENGLETDFVLAFRRWIGTDKENEIKAYIVRENDGREYALEGFLPDEEEYKEIENMSDVEIYDKIEDENYMEQDEINNLWMDQIEYQPKDFLNDFCADYNRVYLDNELTNLEESKLAQDDTEEETTEDEAKEILNKIAASDSQKQDFVSMVKEEGTKRLNDIIIENIVETNDLRNIVDMENKELTDNEVFEKATIALPSGPLVDMFFNVCLTLTENEDLIKLCKKYSKKYLVESEETNTPEEELEVEQLKSDKEEKSTMEEKLDKIIELLTKLVESPKTEEVLVTDEKPVADEPKKETEANVEEEKVDLKSFEERMLKKYNHIAKVEAVLKAPKAIALECLNKSGKKSRLIFTEAKAGLYRTLSNIGLVVENKDNTLVCKRIIKNKRRK